MPKVLLYITAKIIWNFLFYNTDFHENRAHVHVGKRGTEELCKIWLEPNIELAKQGDLTDRMVVADKLVVFTHPLDQGAVVVLGFLEQLFIDAHGVESVGQVFK